MNRTRTTWKQPGSDGAPRQAATSRRADIYTMNQDHPNPGVTDYENGDPDSWAETPTTNKNVEMDYEGDHVRRNEVGFGEIRKDTFDHKDSKEWGGGGKYDNAREASERKASYALGLARTLLRTANEELLMDQAVDLMTLPSGIIAATLKRLEQVSPDALGKESKYRRALACCKLASRVLTDDAPPAAVEKLAGVLMTIDDPTLKQILKITASVRLADSDEDGSQEQQAAPQKSVSQEDQQDQTAAPGADAPQDQQAAPQHDDAPEAQQSQDCMSAEDMQALDQMLSEEMQGCDPCGPAAPAPAPELTNLFQPPVPAAPMPLASAPKGPKAPVSSDITFDGDDDEDGGEPVVASETAELASLFDDHPEVVAQREIQVASGYGVESVTGRTASAKKIGNVRAPRGTGDDDLANLWDRPPAM